MNENVNVIRGTDTKKTEAIVGGHQRVRCLTLNFFSYKMLIPNACVAEVTDVGEVDPKLGAPEWFGGMMNWREQEIPVLIFEKVMNIDASKPQSYRRMIIINAPNNRGCAPFIALGCQSIPSLTMVDESRVAGSDQDNEHATHVLLDGQEYIIPNITELEEKVIQVLAN